MNFWERAFNGIKKAGRDFYQDILNNQRVTLIVVFSILVMVAATTIFIHPIRNHIYASELESVVYNDFKTKKVKFFDYPDGDQTIKKNQAITVMFAKPQGTEYSEALKLLNHTDIESRMNREIYYYPLVYRVEHTAINYNLDGNAITFIFFEEGKEKNRFQYNQLIDAPNQLADSLNRLPVNGMTTETESSEAKTSETAESTENTESAESTDNMESTSSVESRAESTEIPASSTENLLIPE